MYRARLSPILEAHRKLSSGLQGPNSEARIYPVRPVLDLDRILQLVDLFAVLRVVRINKDAAGRFSSQDALLTPSYMAKAVFDSGIKIELAWKVSIVYDHLTKMLFVRFM